MTKENRKKRGRKVISESSEVFRLTLWGIPTHLQEDISSPVVIVEGTAKIEEPLSATEDVRPKPSHSHALSTHLHIFCDKTMPPTEWTMHLGFPVVPLLKRTHRGAMAGPRQN